MKLFYKKINETFELGSGKFIPDGYTEYKKGQEPTELLSFIFKEGKPQKVTEINNSNPANNPVTLTVNSQSITFNGGDASASAIVGAVDLAQKLGETSVKLWDIENVMRDFSFDDAMLISASIAKVWRDAMYERNNKLLAVKNATTSEELELITW